MRVRGIDQSAAVAKGAKSLGVEVVTGDSAIPAAVGAACAGADVVIDTAAVVREDGPRELLTIGSTSAGRW